MGLEIKKLKECPLILPNTLVKLTEMGNVMELQYMTKRNTRATIKMLPGGDEYVDLSSGEVKQVTHHETRADQIKSLSRTFANARAIINTNVTDVLNVRWITLTYKENMRDTVKLYNDFKKFNMRFQTYCKNKGYGKAEYIVMMEPQARGAWHAHLLYIWETRAPYIPNDDLWSIWKHGFTKVKKLDNVDNVGAYLTAYLGDMELEECTRYEITHNGLKQVEIEENGVKTSKYYVKGARLKLYPANFNMIRYSRGIKKPIVEMITQEKAQKKVSAATLTFEKTVQLSDVSNNFESIIHTRYYNKLRAQKQDNNKCQECYSKN